MLYFRLTTTVVLMYNLITLINIIGLTAIIVLLFYIIIVAGLSAVAAVALQENSAETEQRLQSTAKTAYILLPL